MLAYFCTIILWRNSLQVAKHIIFRDSLGVAGSELNSHGVISLRQVVLTLPGVGIPTVIESLSVLIIAVGNSLVVICNGFVYIVSAGFMVVRKPQVKVNHLRFNHLLRHVRR